MALEMNDLPIAGITTLGFVLILFLAAIIISILDRKKQHKVQVEEDPLETDVTKVVTVTTTGEHLDQIFLYLTYIIIFGIIALFLLLGLFGLENISLGDIWPYLLVASILLFGSLFIIERSKVRSKRTVQRDMRKI